MLDKVMLRILLCAETHAQFDFRPTVVGRTGIEVYRAARLPDVKLLAATLGPQVILVDRSFPNVQAFLKTLRQEPATKERSIAILAAGAVHPVEKTLLAAGANAILRLPPDDGWDDRLSRLLQVAARQQARLVVRITVDTAPELAAAVMNLSAGGMLLATQTTLRLQDELGFRLKLPDGTPVNGRGRVVRQARGGYGVEFIELSADHREAIRQFLRSNRMA